MARVIVRGKPNEQRIRIVAQQLMREITHTERK